MFSEKRNKDGFHDKIENKRGFLQSLWHWQPKQNGLYVQMLQDSNIHGMKYIGQPDRHIVERVFWVIILFISCGAAIYLSYGVVETYQKSPVIVSFQPSQTLVSEIPFPAVTVCNVNKFKKSGFELALRIVQNSGNYSAQMVEDAMIVLRHMDHVCRSSSSFSVKFKYSLNDTTVNICNRGVGFECHHHNSSHHHHHHVSKPFTMGVLQMLATSHQSCEEMIPLCLWNEDVISCSEIFRRITTDLGLCCTFNMMPNSLLLRATSESEQITKGLLENVTLDEMKAWNTLDIDESLQNTGPGSKENKMPYLKYQASAGQRTGLSFVLNPSLKEYFCSSHNGYGFRIYPHSAIGYPHVADYGIAVPPNVEMFMGVQAEVTVTEKGIRDVSLGKRLCYFKGEKVLNSFTQYTWSNCIDECLSEEVIKKCTCARFDMPQGLRFGNMSYCEGYSFKCSERVKEDFANIGTKKKCPTCLPSCNRIVYTAKTSSLRMRDDANIWSKSGKNASWAGDNVTIVNVYFSSGIVNSRVRKKLYGFIELFAHVGGILGLFLGLSVISLLEPAYFFLRYLHELEQKTERFMSSDSDKRQQDWKKEVKVVEEFGNEYFRKLKAKAAAAPPDSLKLSR